MHSIDRERDRKSLQDLAKMAQGLAPPPSSVAVPSARSVANDRSGRIADKTSGQDDSGIVDLAAAAAADPGAAMRAQSTPLASQSLFDDVPPPPPVNPPPSMHAYQHPAPSVPPPSVAPSVPPQSYASVHPIGPQVRKKSGAGGVIFAFTGLLAIAGAAAGGFLYMRTHKPAAAVATAPAATVQPVVVADNSPKPTEPAPVIAAPKTDDDGTMDPNALPAVGSRAARPRNAASKAIRVAKADTDSDDSTSKSAPKPEKVAAADTPPPAPAPSGPPGDLGAAMQQAAGPTEAAKQPAAASNGSASMGNVPQKPSQGAVTGALGAVLPAARDCLGPDDPISRASVVFNSDGSVASVTVSGGAAGKPAGACIEKELKKAKLQPFAESSYTANITVRHN